MRAICQILCQSPLQPRGEEGSKRLLRNRIVAANRTPEQERAGLSSLAFPARYFFCHTALLGDCRVRMIAIPLAAPSVRVHPSTLGRQAHDSVRRRGTTNAVVFLQTVFLRCFCPLFFCQRILSYSERSRMAKWAKYKRCAFCRPASPNDSLL